MRFLKEIKLLSSLHHPNIVLFIGACIVKPNVCLVMEMLNKGNLFDFIHSEETKSREKVENDALMIKFAIDIVRGMKYLHHKAKVIQRDLKSRNLLIDDMYTVKVCDFGLSRLDGRDSAGNFQSEGTPYWVAPEVIKKEVAGTQADVYR